MQAQSILQYSHALRSQKLLNPAYNRTGNDISFYTVHRNHWVGVEGAPVAQAFNLQMPFIKYGMGVGFSFINNKWGFFNQNLFMLSYSYTINMENKGMLSFGLQAGADTYKIDETSVVSNSSNYLSAKTQLLPNAGFGMYYRLKNLSAGLSVPKLLSYKATGSNTRELSSNYNSKNMPVYLYAGYQIQLSKDISVEPFAYLRLENQFTTQTDLYAFVHLKDAFSAGVGVRSYKAMVLYVGYKFRNFVSIDYSIDFNTTKFSTITKTMHEIGLLFDIPKRKTPIHNIDEV